jgi:hypothetical protein
MATGALVIMAWLADGAASAMPKLNNALAKIFRTSASPGHLRPLRRVVTSIRGIEKL